MAEDILYRLRTYYPEHPVCVAAGYEIERLRNGIEALESEINRFKSTARSFDIGAAFDQYWKNQMAGEMCKLGLSDLGDATKHNAWLVWQAARQNIREMDVEEWAELYRLRGEVSPPGSHISWKSAAIDERVRRVEAERKLSQAEQS